MTSYRTISGGYVADGECRGEEGVAVNMKGREVNLRVGGRL